MPTRGRQQWAAEAVDMFRDQSYPNKELVVIDDILECSFPGGLLDPAIKYFRIPRQTIGGKRNQAVSRASGDVILHWDSDDIYSPDRIDAQIDFLLSREGVELAGYNEMTFLNSHTGETWHFRQSQPIGVSFCYWRESWEREPFKNIDIGEDIEFSSVRKWAACAAEGRIIARNHNGNTSPRRPQDNPAQWRPTGVMA